MFLAYSRKVASFTDSIYPEIKFWCFTIWKSVVSFQKYILSDMGCTFVCHWAEKSEQ